MSRLEDFGKSEERDSLLYAGSATGKANFGFTVNHQRNGNPNGNAVFVFRSLDPTVND